MNANYPYKTFANGMEQTAKAAREKRCRTCAINGGFLAGRPAE
ncbi:hypothetical protein SD78_0337 [Bacillus badius]|nr:hypothetical protein SD78_0337 [Bacillus badius]